MYNRNPNDVANDRTDVPETYEQDQKRLAESDAAIRRATDPISGNPPPTEEVEPVAESDEERHSR
jgi:hypothetical protein